MTRYLLDSNVLSEPLKARPDEGLVQSLHAHQDRLLLCSPVWHELVYGCLRLPDSQRRRRIEEYLDQVVSRLPLIGYDREAALWHARERARLESVGRPAPLGDSLIASIAGAHNLILVTANLQDFQHFEGLRLEDWRSR